MMRVGAHAADAGKMLERSADAGFFQPAHIGARDRADDSRIGRNRALTDQRVKIEAIAPDRRLEIEHRREIEVDAEPGEFTSVDAAELGRFGLLLVGSKPGERRQRRQLRQRRRKMADDAALLVRRNDQRRQAGGSPLVLERRDLGTQRLDGPAADVVPGDVDASDQALLGEVRDLREGGITDHEVRSEPACFGGARREHVVLAQFEFQMRRRHQERRQRTRA